jgi:putative transposase
MLRIFEEEGSKNTANKMYQFWIQDDGAKEIYSEDFLTQKTDYIHHNPVRAQIVIQPEDYAWSSARLIAKDDFQFLDPIGY